MAVVLGGIDVDFDESFTEMFNDIFKFVPKLVAAIVIFLIGWFVAKLIFRVLHKVLSRIGVDALVDKSGLGGPLEQAGYPDSAKFLAKIIYIMLMLIVLQLAIDVLNITAIEDLLSDFISWIPNLFVALIIVFLTGAIANFVRGFLGGMLQSQSWGNFVTNVAVAAVWLIGIFAALDQAQFAEDIVDTMFQSIMAGLVFIIVIKFGVGGIWAARDRFWPGVYDKFGSVTADTSATSADD